MPEPDGLEQSPDILLTVYIPPVVTVIEFVVAPLLHRIDPPVGIDNVELPQLFTTVTRGFAGIGFGAAMAVPAALMQP